MFHQEDKGIRKRWLGMEWTNNDVFQAHDLGDTEGQVNVAFMVVICYCFLFPLPYVHTKCNYHTFSDFFFSFYHLCFVCKFSLYYV